MAQIADFASLKDSVAERIRRDIITGSLAPGQLIRDNELAARYGVSTSPVREALIYLETERLVEMPANRVKRVSPVDRKSAQDFFAVYRTISLASFAWGAPNVTDRHLARMEDGYCGVVAAFGANEHYEATLRLREFFLPVYEASGNGEVVHMIMRRLSLIERLSILIGHWQRDFILPRLEAITHNLYRGDFSEAIYVHHGIANAMETSIDRSPVFDDAGTSPKSRGKRQPRAAAARP